MTTLNIYMKIALLTSFSEETIESIRIKEEIEKLGHEAVFMPAQEFGFNIVNDKLTVPGITDKLADVVIMRGILNSIKSVSAVVRNLRKKGIRVFDNNLLEHQYSIDKVTDLL